MTHVENGRTITVTFTAYDTIDGTLWVTEPFGRRIAKEVNGTIVEKYLWADRTTLLAVYDGSDNLLQRYTYADGRVPVSMTAGGATYFLLTDQVGSLRAVADTSGCFTAGGARAFLIDRFRFHVRPVSVGGNEGVRPYLVLDTGLDAHNDGPDEAEEIVRGLEAIRAEIEAGQFDFDPALEDIHMAVETRLIARVGEVGRKLHTARSRNDQVALDVRLYLAGEVENLIEALTELRRAGARLGRHHLDPIIVKKLVELVPANRPPTDQPSIESLLTPREQEILPLLTRGLSNQEIGKSLCWRK